MQQPRWPPPASWLALESMPPDTLMLVCLQGSAMIRGISGGQRKRVTVGARPAPLHSCSRRWRLGRSVLR